MYVCVYMMCSLHKFYTNINTSKTWHGGDTFRIGFQINF